MKKDRKPATTMALCAWCRKTVRIAGKGKQVSREVPVAETGFKADDFVSHGICTACAAELRKEIKAVKNPASNPPAWVRDKGKWKEAVKLAQVSYGQKIGSKQIRNIYAVIVAIYKNLGGRVTRKVKRNPSEAEWQAVVDLFCEFHDFEPTSAVVRKVDSLVIPDVLVRLGDLVEVTYRSNKFDKRSRLYIHKFGRDKPILAASGDGKLFIIGGGFKITERGIER
jgi:hypothetical protein